MNDSESVEHGFVMPWFTTPVASPMHNEYFPNDYPVDNSLVISESQQDKGQDN